MKKKILFSILVCSLILTTACGKKDDKKKNNDGDNPTEVKEPVANTASNVIAEANIDGLKIHNVALVTEGESSTFTADVINTTEQDIDIKSFNIILRDENGTEIITLLGYVGKTITPGSVETITNHIDMDLTNVKSVEYVRNY